MIAVHYKLHTSTTFFNFSLPFPPLIYITKNTTVMQISHLLTLILVCFSSNYLTAQTFDTLDYSFGEIGKVVVDMNGHRDNFQTMLLQPDGKLIMAGSNYHAYDQSVGQQSDFALVRLNPDGSLDKSFGDNGQIITTFGNTREEITTITLTGDGKILIAGNTTVPVTAEEETKKVVLMRYHSDGNLDKTFGDEGITILDIATISANTGIIDLPNSDDFLLTNYRGWKDYGSNAIIRLFELVGFDENGKIDSTFGDNGKLVYSKEKLDIEYFDGVEIHNNKIYLAGTKQLNNLDNFALARFNLTGELDTLFGDKGVASVNFGYSAGAYAQQMVFQPDNSIVVMGMAIKGPKGDFALARFDKNGQIDKTFGTEGKVTTEFTNYSALAIQSDDYPMHLFLAEDGKILLIGHSGPNTANNYWNKRTIAIAKYESDGRLDATFGNKGKLLLLDYNKDTSIPHVFLKQIDHKIIFGGYITNEVEDRDFQLVRFLSDFNVGTFNSSVIANETLVYPNPIKNATILEYTLENTETLTIQLTDLQGQILKTYLQNQPQKAGTYQQQIDLSTDLSTGMYLVRLSSPNGQMMIKVVK